MTNGIETTKVGAQKRFLCYSIQLNNEQEYEDYVFIGKYVCSTLVWSFRLLQQKNTVE